MLAIIFKNLLGYDILILLLAGVTGFYIYPRAVQASKELQNQLQPTIYIPINILLKEFRGNQEDKYDLHKIKALRDKEVTYINILNTVLSVFPLMGILGTIISLLRMVDLASGDIIFNFTTALTSTFWGLVFAIIFKGMTISLLSSNEQNSEDFELLIRRIDSVTRIGDLDEKE